MGSDPQIPAFKPPWYGGDACGKEGGSMTDKLMWCNIDNHRILVLRRRRKYDVVHVAETLVPAAFSQFAIDAQRHNTQ